jgi:hypothetical protein
LCHQFERVCCCQIDPLVGIQINALALAGSIAGAIWPWKALAWLAKLVPQQSNTQIQQATFPWNPFSQRFSCQFLRQTLNLKQFPFLDT